jgi:hypothetical protein|tara:strand:- start:20 stop:124 length:105 start_codon:yes stop_codon:yes gene_type:complete
MEKEQIPRGFRGYDRRVCKSFRSTFNLKPKPLKE